MKKLLLSGGVVGLFLLYGWHQQQEAAEIKVTPPSSSLPSDQSKPTAPDTSNTQGIQNQDQMQNTPSQNTQVHQSQGQYRDGTYTGSVADAFYGNIQVQAVIRGGKIVDVTFLQYPNDRRESIMINEQAMPYLTQEAIQAQSAHVDIVSGATDSSQAFQESFQSALDQSRR